MTAFDKNRDLEFSQPAAIRNVQAELLQRHIRYASTQSPYYRRLFAEQGIDAAAITLDTLHRLPLTDKAQLSGFNEDFFAVPRSAVSDIVLSSGTTGLPTVVMYTGSDLERLAYNEEISFAGCGITRDDVVLLTCTMDRCFIAGLAYYSGVRRIGAAAIRNGLSSVESHYEIIERLKPTVLVGVPSFLLKLGRYLGSRDRDPKQTGIRKLVCIGEPVRDRAMAFTKLGEHLEEVWGARIYSTYASSETITSFCECEAQQGGHLHPDLAVVEIVDDSGQPLPPGQEGEVVVTPLQMEGMPLIRFKTGDVSFLLDAPCACGRFSPRLGPILGRKKQMIKFRGTTLYPNAIFQALDEIPFVTDYFVIATNEYELSETIGVTVSVRDASCTAQMVVDRLQARLRVRPEVAIKSAEFVREQVYPANSRKPIRFVDKRTKP